MPTIDITCLENYTSLSGENNTFVDNLKNHQIFVLTVSEIYALTTTLCLMIFVGLAANGRLLFVISKRRGHVLRVFDVLIGNMTVGNILYLIIRGGNTVAITLTNGQWLWGDALCRMFSFFAPTLSTMMKAFQCLTSLDRLIRIRYPMSSRCLKLNVKSTRIVIVVVWILIIISFSPIFTMVKMKEIQAIIGVVHTCVNVDGDKENYRVYYSIQLIISFYLPCVIMFLANFLIIASLLQHGKRRRQILPSSTKAIVSSETRDSAAIKGVLLSGVMVNVFLLTIVVLHSAVHSFEHPIRFQIAVRITETVLVTLLPIIYGRSYA